MTNTASKVSTDLGNSKILDGEAVVSVKPRRGFSSRKKKAIAMICDDAYVLPCITAITSLCVNSHDMSDYVFYVCVNDMTKANVESIKLFANEPWNLDIRIIELQLDKYRSIYEQYDGNTGAGSITALAKFDLPHILAEDQVLYLDGDIIVQHDLSELFDIDLGEKVAAVVRDSGKIYRRGGLREELPKYFNSGVMLLNLKMMRENGFTQKLIDDKIKLNNPKLVDQDAFNIAFRGFTKLLPIQYNALLVNLHNSRSKFTMTALNNFYNTSFSSLYDLDENACIVHFASKEKPWKYSDVYFSQLWMEYYKQSPLAGRELRRGLFHKESPNGGIVYNVPVMLATDANYFPQTYVTILSVIKNRNPYSCLAFYILVPQEVSAEGKQPFEKLQLEYENVTVSFVVMGADLFSDAKLSIKHITSPTFYRLKAPGLFPQYKRMVYIDSDVIVEGDITELFNVDIGDNYIAGVKAASYHFAKNGNALYCQQNGLPGIDQYINAGVIVMNLETMRRDGVEAEFLHRAKLGYRSQDQDVINGACYGHIYHLPYKYNCQITKYELTPEVTRKIFSAEEVREAENQPLVIHYAAEVKPWADFACALSDRWWKYAKQSPFYNYFIETFAARRIRNGVSARIRWLQVSASLRSLQKRENASNVTLRGQIDALTEEVKVQKAARSKNWNERMKFSSELKRLKASKSYRIGRFLTWPVRKIRRVFSKKS